METDAGGHGAERQKLSDGARSPHSDSIVWKWLMEKHLKIPT